VNDPVSDNGAVPVDGSGNAVQYYKKEFWTNENLNYSRPHLRMEKAARIIKAIAQGKDRSLLDVGCGPATMMRLLPPNVRYYGIDIAIHDPAPNLMEIDLVENPVGFGDKKFDIVLAQGFFEYVGEVQSKKLAEISKIINPGGKFITSYVNFGHRQKDVYWPYNNVRSLDSFEQSLTRNFKIEKSFPSSYNWNHHAPRRRLLKTINLHLNINVPVLGSMLAVEYFFVCSPRA
jgi:SAM-dependent methyltransferase